MPENSFNIVLSGQNDKIINGSASSKEQAMGESSGWQLASTWLRRHVSAIPWRRLAMRGHRRWSNSPRPGRGSACSDVACGTGVVARYAAPLVGPTGRVVGLDRNAEMLTLARAMPQHAGVTIAWQEGNATALPFPDASFDLVCCQQGLQLCQIALPRSRRCAGSSSPGDAWPWGCGVAGASALLCGAGRSPRTLCGSRGCHESPRRV